MNLHEKIISEVKKDMSKEGIAKVAHKYSVFFSRKDFCSMLSSHGVKVPFSVRKHLI